MKTYSILILLLAMRLTAACQTSVRLILKSDIKIDSVFLFDIDQNEIQKGAYRDALILNFKKDIIGCYSIKYIVNQKAYQKQLLWFNPGNITVNAHLADTTHLVVDTVINSPIYYRVVNYFKQMVKLRKDTSARNHFLLSEIDDNLENPFSTYLATTYININQNSKANLLKLKLLLSRQKTDFSGFYMYHMGIERLNKLLEIKTIDLSKFQFINRDKRIVKLNIGDDQFTLLDFWFVGCVPCMEQHKELKLNIQKLSRNHIKVIGVANDKKFAPWFNYLSQHGYQWDNYLQAGENTLTAYLSINSFPSYLLLNQKGEIVKTYDSLDEILNNLPQN